MSVNKKGGQAMWQAPKKNEFMSAGAEMVVGKTVVNRTLFLALVWK